jgi:hypothetical protein
LSTESDLATSTLPSRASSSWSCRTSTVLPAPTSPLSATRRPAWIAAFTCLMTFWWCSVAKKPASSNGSARP